MKYYILAFFAVLGYTNIFAQNNLTFEQCLSKAYEFNLQVKQVEQQALLSDIEVQQAKYNFLPAVNGQVGLSNSFGRSVDPFTNAFTNDNILSTNYSLSSNVTLFAGLQKWKSLKQARINQDKSDYDKKKAKNDVTLLTASSFLQVMLNEEVVETSRERKKLLEEQLSNMEKMVDAGRLPVSNLLDLKVQLASEEFNLANSISLLEKSKLQLAQLMGIADSKSIELLKPEISDPQSNGSLPELNSILDNAKATFPQFKSAELDVRSNELGLQVARSRYYPSVNLNGVIFTGTSSAVRFYDFNNGTTRIVPIGYLTNDPTQTVSTVNFEPLVTDYPYGNQLSDNVRQQMSLNVSIPLFNGMATRAGVQRSKVQLELSRIAFQNVENQLQNDIQNAYLDVQTAQRNFVVSKAQLASMEEAMKSAKIRFDSGMMNATDYRTALNNKSKAESDLIRAKYQYVFNTKILDFYLGKEITF